MVNGIQSTFRLVRVFSELILGYCLSLSTWTNR